MPRLNTKLSIPVPSGTDELAVVINWLLFHVAPAAPAELLDWLLGRTVPPAWVELLLDLDDDELSEVHLEMFRERTMQAALENRGEESWEVPIVTETEAVVLTELEATQDTAGIRVEPERRPVAPFLDIRPAAEDPGTFAVFSTETGGPWSGWWLGTQPSYRDGIAIRGDQSGAAPDYIRCTPLQAKPTREWQVVFPGGEYTVAGRESRRGPSLVVDLSLHNAQTKPGSWRITRLSTTPLVLEVTASNAELHSDHMVTCIDTLHATVTFDETLDVNIQSTVRFSQRSVRAAARLWPAFRLVAKRSMQKSLQHSLTWLTTSDSWPAVVVEAQRET